jgi:hypothetical protein
VQEHEALMAAHGAWHRQGATLRDVTAKAAYGVRRDVMVHAIQPGTLAYREGSRGGNPSLRVLRSQLEPSIAAARGEDDWRSVKHQTELRSVNKERADLQKTLAGLQERQQERAASLGT